MGDARRKFSGLRRALLWATRALDYSDFKEQAQGTCGRSARFQGNGRGGPGARTDSGVKAESFVE